MDWEKIHKEIEKAIESGDVKDRLAAKQNAAYIQNYCMALSQRLDDNLLSELRWEGGPIAQMKFLDRPTVQEFYRKVIKAIYLSGEYWHTLERIHIIVPGEAILWIGSRHMRQCYPYPIYIHWTVNTTIKSIVETMQESGFGTRDFDVVFERRR